MKDLSKGDTEKPQAVTWADIDEAAAGQRIDNFLLRSLKGVPKSHVYRILRSGEVRVNSRRIDATYRLVSGDRVRIPPVRVAISHAPAAPASTGIGRRTVFEDDSLLVIDKPAGVAVHGGSGVSSGVIERLRAERPQAKFLELVHRLDRETSGLLLVAKKRSALTHLHEQLRAGTTDKRYLALAGGRVRDLKRRVRIALHKYTTAEGERRVVPDPEGQAAETVFHRKSVYQEATLLEAQLLTGRTHQIRVHLQQIGHPIAGDDKYGDFQWNRQLARAGLKRMFLHAARLSIEHPVTGERLELASPLPPELQNFLDHCEPWNDAST
ncbi:MAG: RluA family pseudouridine synthase [Pseudomonadota bacterium]|nr:RluA family pseudouridine synthase [Pseudomonadota bacterium]